MDLLDGCIGDRVAAAMEAAGVDLADLARRCGMRESHLAPRLVGPGSFTVVELAYIALALDCTLLALVPAGDCGQAGCCPANPAA
jgi:hypothetical protein